MKPSGVCVVLLLTLLIRVAILLLTPDALQSDPDGYRRLAANLVEHGTFGDGDAPTAFRPPLYPLLIAADYSRTAIGVLHVILGVATVGLVLLLGHWWGRHSCLPVAGKNTCPTGATLAALLVACDPILLSQSTQVMTETPATFLAVAGLTALMWAGRRPTPSRAVLAGIVLALGALCRPTLLLWAIAAGLAFWLQSQSAQKGDAKRHDNSRELTAPGGLLSSLRLPAMLALGALLVLSPWAIRNQIQFGRPIVTTTHGGYTLLLANNPEFYQWLRSGEWGTVWDADAFNAAWDQRKPRDELLADRLAYSEAWENIGREPSMFCYACLTRLGRFWSPLPHQITADETPLRRASRYAVAVWYILEFLLVAAGVVWFWRNNESSVPRSSFLILHCLLLVACLSAVHTVFWTDMRMRSPTMPVIALAAAAGAMGLKRVPCPRLPWA